MSIEQLTLRKLEYVRSLLKAVNLPHSGPRPKVRKRLVDAIDSNCIAVATLKALLDELDAWGDQRVRIGRLSASMLAEFQSADAIAHKVTEAGMGHLLHGEVDLVPPLDLTPVKIFYEEQAGRKQLRLVAAKTRQLMLPQPQIPDHVDRQYPEVIFKPFNPTTTFLQTCFVEPRVVGTSKTTCACRLRPQSRDFAHANLVNPLKCRCRVKVETQKALAFAEISLDNGLTFISTTLLRQGQGYIAEFSEFFTVFRPLIALHEIDTVPLYNATYAIRQLPISEVRLVARQTRTSVGGWDV
jgi:hypothetical protein